MKKVADLENQVEQETSEVNTEEVVEETVEETENAEKTETTEDKKAAKKADKKKAKVDKKADAKCEAMQAKIDELEDRVKRQMAEFENFRKRTEKEKTMMFETGAKSVVEKILPVVDNFERGLATIPEEDADSAFASGMKMIYKQMMDELDKLGVKPIEAVGQEFNPDLHNAVMHVEDETVGENIIVEEFQKGYTYRDSVVRYSMVKVAN